MGQNGLKSEWKCNETDNKLGKQCFELPVDQPDSEFRALPVSWWTTQPGFRHYKIHFPYTHTTLHSSEYFTFLQFTQIMYMYYTFKCKHILNRMVIALNWTQWFTWQTLNVYYF